MQQAIQDYAAELKEEEEYKMMQLREKELAAQEKVQPFLIYVFFFASVPTFRESCLSRGQRSHFY